MKRLLYLPAVSLLFLTLSCADQESVESDEAWGPMEYRTQYQDIRVTKITGGLDRPWAVAFLPDGRFLVTERPGRLVIIDNGEIRNQTGSTSYWKGIEVWGDKNQPQTITSGMPIHQGMILVTNEGVIRNARVGINAIKVDSNGSYDWSKTGGIVKLDNARLINNYKGVFIGGYKYSLNGFKHPNASIIKNSEFITQDPLMTDLGHYCHIALYNINRVSILGNLFTNTTSIHFTQKETGIIAINASIVVNQLCTSQTFPCADIERNRFVNLKYGIQAIGLHSNTIIKNSLFEKCRQAIYLENQYFPVVTENNFIIPKAHYSSNLALIYDGIGIFVSGGYGFKIEENDFTTLEVDNSRLVGIFIINTGHQNNEIYNNKFVKLDAGVLTNFVNRNPNNRGGLKFICNKFQDGWHDHLIWSFPPNYLEGIARDQVTAVITPNSGINILPAGEKFTLDHDYRVFYEDYNNKGGYINYYWFLDGINKTAPTRFYNIYLQEVGLENQCLSKIDNGNGGSNLSSMYSNLSIAKSHYNSHKVILGVWENGGNSELPEEVATTLPWEVYVMFNDLIAESPFLSEETLLEVIDNPDFTSLMVKLIMIANPHSARLHRVMEALYERVPAMPQSYIDEIEAMVEVESQLDILHGNVSGSLHLVNMIENDIKRTYYNDTLNSWANDSLIAFVSRLNTLSDRYDLANFLLYDYQFEEMETALSNIPIDFELSDEENIRHNYYIDLFSIARELFENDNYFSSLETEQINQLESILELNDYRISSFALSLLKINNPNFEHNNYSLPPIPEPSKSQTQKHANSENKMNKVKNFEIYPNPAIDFITIIYKLDDNIYNKAWIVLHNSNGKKIMSKHLESLDSEKLINLSEISKGSYTISLYADGELISVEKLIKLK